MDPVFATDYDFESRRVVRPFGRDFDLVITPRFADHYEKQPYEGLTADLLASVLCGRELFVDVGAHSGFFALLAAKRHPRVTVLALEPIAENYRLLQEGIARNGLANVEALASAASDHVGEARFFVSTASDNGSFVPHPATPTLREVTVPTVTLDSLLAGRAGATRAVVKIDTDGHEMAVLDGMKDSVAGADLRLFVELNPKVLRLAGHTPEALIARLQGMGFDVFLIEDARRRFLRLGTPADWRHGCEPQGYANLYCVPRERSLSVALFAHDAKLYGAQRSLLANVTALVEDQGAVCTVVLFGDGPLRAKLDALGAATLVADLPWWCDALDPGAPDVHARLRRGAAALAGEVLPPLTRAAPDVIETMTITAPWGALTAAVLDRPHVWNICEDGGGFFFFVPFNEVTSTIAASNLVLAPSEPALGALFPDHADARFQVVGRWFEAPEEARRAARRERGARARLAVFGSLFPAKDQATAIRALAGLRGQGHDVELLLAGDGPDDYRAELDLLAAELGVADHVLFAGFVDQPLRLMQGVDVLLSTSPREFFGRTPLEAALVGCPSVVARGSGPTAHLRDGHEALWFAPGDARDLAEKVAVLLNDQGRAREIAAKAAALAEGAFSRAAVSTQRFELLSALRGAPNELRRQPLFTLLHLLALQEPVASADPRLALLAEQYERLRESYEAVTRERERATSFAPWRLRQRLARIGWLAAGYRKLLGTGERLQ